MTLLPISGDLLISFIPNNVEVLGLAVLSSAEWLLRHASE